MFKPCLNQDLYLYRMIYIKAVLYKSKKLKNGEHPIMLRIIKDRKVQYLSTGKSCSPKMWSTKNNLPRSSHPLFREYSILIGKKKVEAEKIILEHENSDTSFTGDQLKVVLKKKRNKSETVFNCFLNFISRMKDSGQIKNSLVYKDALRELKKFTLEKDLGFHQIDVAFLNRYEEFMKKCNLGPSTIYLYLRTLRALFNKAIEENYCDKACYPFSKFSLAKYAKIKTAKRAISKIEIKKIEKLKFSEDSSLYHAKNIFIFSYYNWGINFVDIAHLKWKNIKDNRLTYRRKKTKENFTIGMLHPAIRILKYYRKSQTNDGYIFPILNEVHDTPLKVENRLKKILRQINKDLKEIALLAGIDEKLTTYVARHSFATIMKKSGVSNSIIKETLGHDSEKTTQIYLDDFENAVLDDATKALL